MGTKMELPITLVLLGDIAAGKGTQAEILCRKYNLKLISTGAYTRKYWTGNSKISKRLEKTKLGKLTPSDIIKSFLREELTKLKPSEQILIDGGKMPSEARLIYKLLKQKGRLPLVIYLRISIQEIFHRLTYRYYDKKTGMPLTIDPARVREGSYKGRHVIKRADDDLQAIQKRFDYYDKIYSKTVEFWSGRNLLRKVNGRQPVQKVTRDIAATIKKFYGSN